MKFEKPRDVYIKGKFFHGVFQFIIFAAFVVKLLGFKKLDDVWLGDVQSFQVISGIGFGNFGIIDINIQTVPNIHPGGPTTIKTMGVNITTIVYLRVLIIEIGSTIILMVVEA